MKAIKVVLTIFPASLYCLCLAHIPTYSMYYTYTRVELEILEYGGFISAHTWEDLTLCMFLHMCDISFQSHENNYKYTYLFEKKW